jgi:hypothetical protein
MRSFEYLWEEEKRKSGGKVEEEAAKLRRLRVARREPSRNRNTNTGDDNEDKNMIRWR